MRNVTEQPAPLDLPPVDISMIRIYGQLLGPMKQPITNTVIRLRALTTNAIILQDSWSEATTDASGNYDFSVVPGKYAVFLNWLQKPQRLNNIVVYADSAPGMLQSFMLTPSPDQLTPVMIQEVKAAAAEAAIAVLRSRQWAENPEDVPVLNFEQGAGPEYSAYHWAKKSAESAAESIGLNWRDEWSSESVYEPHDAVFYEGSSWFAVTENTDIPPTEGDVWNMMAQKGDVGMTWRGPWKSDTEYSYADGVYYDGSSWFCLSANTNTPPEEGAYWDLYAAAGANDGGHYYVVENNLSEIADAGPDAQEEARINLGIKGLTFDDVYPVGSLYVNYFNASNPADIFGVGTWDPVSGLIYGIGFINDRSLVDEDGKALSYYIHPGPVDGRLYVTEENMVPIAPEITLEMDPVDPHTHKYTDHDGNTQGTGTVADGFTGGDNNTGTTEAGGHTPTGTATMDSIGTQTEPFLIPGYAAYCWQRVA